MRLHPITTTLFVGLVLLMAVLAARAVARAENGVRAAGVVALYLGVPAALALLGALHRYDPMPAPPLLLLLGLTITTVVLAFSGFGIRVGMSVGVGAMVGFQSFRIAVELILHRLAGQDVVPIQMTYSGRNFDIVSGITAAILGFWMARGGRPSRVVLLGWNLLGLALLINIVTVAVLSTPVSFRHFREGPPNLLPSEFPDIWLPSFLVQLALFGHLVMFRLLFRRDVR